MDELVYRTILSFFSDKKEIFLKEFDDLLLKELKTIKCNKFAVINNFNDVIIEKHKECYEKLLEAYQSNYCSPPDIDHYILSDKILKLIKNYFESDDEYKKIAPTIKDLIKDYSDKLEILYNISSDYLSSNNKKIS